MPTRDILPVSFDQPRSSLLMRALCGVGDVNRRADALLAGPHARWRAELNAQR